MKSKEIDFLKRKVEPKVKDTIVLAEEKKERERRKEEERWNRELAEEQERLRIEQIAYVDTNLGTEILDTIDGRPITNPYLLLKAQELRSLINNKDKTYLEKKKLIDGESDIPRHEKWKYVIERVAPRHSSIPITAHLEADIVNMQDPLSKSSFQNPSRKQAINFTWATSQAQKITTGQVKLFKMTFCIR